MFQADFALATTSTAPSSIARSAIFEPAWVERTDDDDRHGPVLLKNLQKRQAVHARHLDVERQHVRLQFQNHVARDVRIAGGADDFDFRVRSKGVGNHAADDGGVVHNQHTDFFSEAHAMDMN